MAVHHRPIVDALFSVGPEALGAGEENRREVGRFGRISCWWPALAATAGSFLLHLFLLAIMGASKGMAAGDRLLAWDGLEYIRIAAHGYPTGFTYSGGRLTGNSLAFFPLYPMLVSAVHEITRLPYDMSAVILSQVFLVAALITLLELFSDLYGRRTALVALVLVVGAQPMAVAFHMAYSESLFLALSVGALLAARRRAWLVAGVLTAFAGLTRPAGVAVTASLAVAVAMGAIQARRLEWRLAAALVIGSAGVPGYIGWVALRTGHLDAWFAIQSAGWGTKWDNGSAFFDFLGSTLSHDGGWVAMSTALLLIGTVCATLGAWQGKKWPPLLVYGTGIVVLALGQSNYFHSKLRLLLPALIFLVPAARAIASARPRTAVITLAALTLFGTWYGAYMLTVWPYAI